MWPYGVRLGSMGSDVIINHTLHHACIVHCCRTGENRNWFYVVAESLLRLCGYWHNYIAIVAFFSNVAFCIFDV